jgi:hypothetical protein
LGQIDLLTACVSRAQQTVSAGFGSPHRRERYYDVLGALGLYLDQKVRAPGPIGALALLFDADPEIARGAAARGAHDLFARPMIARLVARELRLGRVDRVERLLEPQAEEKLPGIARVVEAVLSSLA